MLSNTFQKNDGMKKMPLEIFNSNEMKNILVGVDFNEKTELLIAKAQELAERYDAKLWLLHAVAPLPDFVGFDVVTNYTNDGMETILENEQKVLEDYVNKMKLKGIDAEGILIQGATIDVIVEESQKQKVDLIVCGHHEHNFLYNIFFGSISLAVIRHSDIPVLVYPLG
jgi:nucleotide-binding universal stress UspA family protein